MLSSVLRSQLQVSAPFLQLVHNLNVLHHKPCRNLSSSADEGPSSSSSSHEGGDVMEEFHRKVAAVQAGQSHSSASAWLQPNTTWQQEQQHSVTTAGSHTRRGSSRGDAAAAAERGGDEYGSSSSSSSSSHLVSPEYGYAVLGGVDPEASQQVAGAQQPKLHPTKSFDVREMYDPLDLSPLARDEEEPWVPVLRRGLREASIPADEVLEQLDYKNIDFLLNFVSASGRIKPRRQTRLHPRLQSRVARTVKLARQLALIPYEMRVGDGEADWWRSQREYRAAQAASGQPSSS